MVDYLPEQQLDEVRNLDEFAGMLALDNWTGNCNGRQAVFDRKPRERRYRATFIDQGFCFNAGEWTFPDSPLRGVYARNRVYAGVTGWESFEPWLSRIETMDAEKLWGIAELFLRNGTAETRGDRTIHGTDVGSQRREYESSSYRFGIQLGNHSLCGIGNRAVRRPQAVWENAVGKFVM